MFRICPESNTTSTTITFDLKLLSGLKLQNWPSRFSLLYPSTHPAPGATGVLSKWTLDVVTSLLNLPVASALILSKRLSPYNGQQGLTRYHSPLSHYLYHVSCSSLAPSFPSQNTGPFLILQLAKHSVTSGLSPSLPLPLGISLP